MATRKKSDTSSSSTAAAAKPADEVSALNPELREQLLAAAARFSESEKGLEGILSGIVSDMERAYREPLEVVPVAHHSPACALHMLQRLHEKAPKVIFMEGCEDMVGQLELLRECSLPVALQGFASESADFPPEWFPLTVVLPLTEFSAEFQAISYALAHDDVEIVFVDRSVDHIFQNMPQEPKALDEVLSKEEELDDQEEDDEDEQGRKQPRITHGSSLGVEMGRMEPTFDEFRAFLLRNANVRHFAEWWDQYVEQPLLESNYDTFRHVMYLVGSLLRRLGRQKEDIASDEWRERYMWTRIKEYMAKHKVKPEEAVYICGAIHAASDVEQFGTLSDTRWEIPAPTKTQWLYGMIPSSYSAIERQFGHPPGTVSLAEATWKKGLESRKLKPFSIKAKAKSRKASSASAGQDSTAQLSAFLNDAPDLRHLDEEQLLGWSVDVVKLARKNGYLASTADSIAIFQTSKLLAGIRNRPHPTPYDFRDAAVTCLEKNRIPKKRDIGWICDILLGGDRVGKVGYDSMPQLAKDVYDRLAVLPVNVSSSTVQRALMDFKKHPEYLPGSDLLWKLHYLLGSNQVLRPIMGERTLGHKPIQESWDIAIGRYQGSIIQLAYEGLTVEQVLEQRLKKLAFGPKSKTLDALRATEDSILFLKSRRLTDELGRRAVELLRLEPSAKDAQEIFEQVRRLVHYYRSQPDGLADWIKDFVATGYQHFATLLPESFDDRDTSPDEIAGMMAFIFTLESLALSLGCDRSQLLIAIRMAGTLELRPDKLGLLWSAEYLLGERSLESIRRFFDEALSNPLILPALPDYVSGFVLALRFTPLVSRLVVELLSKAFERLPDSILMPWLPGLIMTLKPLGLELMPTLLKDAASFYPGKAQALDSWKAPWELVIPQADDEEGDDEDDASSSTSASAGAGQGLSPAELAAKKLLFGAGQPVADALAERLGLKGGQWTPIAEEGASQEDAKASAKPKAKKGAKANASAKGAPGEAAAQALLNEHAEAMDALAARIKA